MVADVRGIVVDHRAAKPVAVGIMTEGPLRLSGILQGLAEREMQVEAIVGADVRAFERRRHRRDVALPQLDGLQIRSEEHTSELQSLMRISYAVFCLKKKKQNTHHNND